jgi:hypothetical protein
MKPFNLSQGKKRTFDEAASIYVPLAQWVEAFHKGKLICFSFSALRSTNAI